MIIWIIILILSNINIKNTEITYITDKIIGKKKGNIYVNDKKKKFICLKYKMNINTIEYPVNNKFFKLIFGFSFIEVF